MKNSAEIDQVESILGSWWAFPYSDVAPVHVAVAYPVFRAADQNIEVIKQPSQLLFCSVMAFSKVLFDSRNNVHHSEE
jgi:hypothetical protein